jgi:WD40 repeat protein
MFRPEAARQGHSGYIWKILSEPRGVLCTASRDGTIRRGDHQIAGPGGAIGAIALHGDTLYGATRSGILFRVDGDRCTEVSRVDGAVIDRLALPGGALVAACADGSIVRGEVKRQVHRGWATAIAGLPGIIASVGHDGAFVLSRDDDLAEVDRQTMEAPLCSVTAGENRVYIGDHTGHVTDLGKIHDGAVTALQARGPFLATGGEDACVRVWDLRTRKMIAETRHRDFVRCIVWTSDEECVSVGYDAELHVTAL